MANPAEAPSSAMTNSHSVNDLCKIDIGVEVPPPADLISVKVESSEPRAAVLVWKDLSVKIRGTPKILLKGVSGKTDGGFWAVMGPSGSGKSTLLNALACRMDAKMRVKGEMRLNGREYSSTELKAVSGYVMQDDLLNAHLTAEETLDFSAQLRLPASLSKKERARRVEDSLQQMGLGQCRNTVIGSPLRKGISGGERKRLCVAMELVTRPQLLFLDEPTSGLDSVTALSLCRRLRAITDTGACTVICTIHQPQSKIFSLFDNLIIMNAGNIVYQGDTPGCLDFYEASGFPCPPYTNPADHLLDVITPPLPNQESGPGSKDIANSTSSLYDMDQKLQQLYVPPIVDLNTGQDRPMVKHRDVTPYWRQYTILLKRCLMEQARKWDIILTQLAQNAVMAALIGGVFPDLGTGQASVNRRQSVLFFCVINQGVFGSLNVINSFPSERLLVLRERAAGTYYVSAYFLAKISGELLPQILNPIVFSIIVYWMVGFQAVASKFFIFMAFMILCNLAATSLALAVSALCRTVDLSVTVLPMALELARLFGGFFLSPANLPKYFSWIDAFSYVKYTFVGISLNELNGLEYTCSEQQVNNGTCYITSGQQVVDTNGLGFITIGAAAGILIAYIFLCRLVAFVGIRFFKS